MEEQVYETLSGPGVPVITFFFFLNSYFYHDFTRFWFTQFMLIFILHLLNVPYYSIFLSLYHIPDSSRAAIQD